MGPVFILHMGYGSGQHSLVHILGRKEVAATVYHASMKWRLPATVMWLTVTRNHYPSLHMGYVKGLHTFVHFYCREERRERVLSRAGKDGLPAAAIRLTVSWNHNPALHRMHEFT